ncbi:MAG: hypothetical protein JWP91_63 [Fibrobacteres bacterium]|nr:hypothetical protein [Fibrobacterota bacterium]
MRIQSQAQASGSGNQAEAAVPSASPINPVRTLIMNEGLPVQDRDSLRLVVQCILRNNRNDPEVESLIQAVSQSGNRLDSHDDVATALRNVIAERMKDTSYFERGLEILIKLSEHELNTTRNRTAFAPSTKENPDTVFWPDPTHPKHPRTLHGEKAFARRHKFINRGVPVGSAGSCFASRIAEMLQKQNFNYVVTEPNLSNDGKTHNSCARWGIIFNVPSFRQLVERAFGMRKIPRLLWVNESNGKRILMDPFREDISFDSVEEYERDIEIHTAGAREAFMKSKVFVMTLGMNEVWYLKSENAALARAPWGIASSLVESRVLTVEENVYELQRMLDLWRSYNPEIKLIVTTSPVPLHATFRGSDYHVITANAHSKSTLRLAAQEFAERNKDVFYFPAYETVLYGTKNPWEEDQRHVSQEAVRNVMSLFGEMFVSDDWSPAT